MIRRRPRAARQFDRAEDVAATLSGVLMRGLRDALRNAPMHKSAKRRLTEMGLIRKKAGCFSELTRSGLKVLRAASGMEAGTGETEGLDPKDDSPVTNEDSADAPNVSRNLSPSNSRKV